MSERSRKLRIVRSAGAVPEIVSESTAEQRGNRAMALMCAAVCWRGDPTDCDGLMGVAEEFLEYIEGKSSNPPSHDKLTGGQIPKPKR